MECAVVKVFIDDYTQTSNLCVIGCFYEIASRFAVVPLAMVPQDRTLPLSPIANPLAGSDNAHLTGVRAMVVVSFQMVE